MESTATYDDALHARMLGSVHDAEDALHDRVDPSAFAGFGLPDRLPTG